MNFILEKQSKKNSLYCHTISKYMVEANSMRNMDIYVIEENEIMNTPQKRTIAA